MKVGEPLDECRVLLVGESQVGKTSLSCALREEAIPHNQKSTWGFDIHRYAIDQQQDLPKLHLWDFGGQHVMHATHCHYFSERCLYLLVLDATRIADGRSLKRGERQEDHPDAGNLLRYWLQLIRRYGKDSPVLVICTKTENETSLELPSFDELRREFKVNLLGEAPIRVDCPPGPADNTGTARKKVLAAITDALSDDVALPETKNLRAHVHAKWHEYWIQVRDDLVSAVHARGRVGRIFYDQVCEEREVPDDDRSDLLPRLHALGELLHYHEASSPELRNTIYDVEWANRAVYALLRLKDVDEFTAEQAAGLIDANARGNKPLTPDECEHTLLVMQQYESCFSISSDQTRVSRYIVPSLRSRMPASTVHAWQADLDEAEPLDCKFEAIRFLHLLTSSLANTLQPLDNPTVESYSDGAYFAYKDGHAFMRVDEERNRLFVTVRDSTLLTEMVGDILRKLWKQAADLSVDDLPEIWQESDADRWDGAKAKEREPSDWKAMSARESAADGSGDRGVETEASDAVHGLTDEQLRVYEPLWSKEIPNPDNFKISDPEKGYNGKQRVELLIYHYAYFMNREKMEKLVLEREEKGELYDPEAALKLFGPKALREAIAVSTTVVDASPTYRELRNRLGFGAKEKTRRRMARGASDRQRESDVIGSAI
ncbi:MAG: hypothetical protein GXP26_10655 [Planctomycetes bacterium]|nr:hypothetical protein [Planctomycetota bacterium]